jgi:hypothetical protein
MHVASNSETGLVCENKEEESNFNEDTDDSSRS